MVEHLNPITLTVVNPSSRIVTGFPVCCGVPLPSDLFSEINEVTVLNQSLELDSQVTALSYWPSGSLRWILVECFVDIKASSELILEIKSLLASNFTKPEHFHDSAISSRSMPSKNEGQRSSFQEEFRYLQQGRATTPNFSMDVTLIGADKYVSRFTPLAEESAVTGDHRSTFQSIGSFSDSKGVFLFNLEIRMDVFHALSLYKLQYTIHNTNAARHTAGFWDLGDSGSSHFQGLTLICECGNDATLHWRASDHSWRDGGVATFSICQNTSGGKIEKSPNHVNSRNEIPDTSGGYVVKQGDETVETGERISPCIYMESNETAFAFALENFWENFPKSINREADVLKVGLFPELYADGFELQGGEKKTHTLYVGSTPESLAWMSSGATVLVNNKSRWNACVLPYDEDVPADEMMDSLIKQGIEGSGSFFQKREKIDEYGWRNFGDVYADHETWQRESTELFASHYNNQYDLIYGFLRMYMKSENPQWFRLAKDLAEHVLDIDLYHTEKDRLEYNGGLFWHTDHYLPAHTSTHRSYSKLQERKPGQLAGGGPGGEHCYTTGLKLYYLTTGSDRAKTAVVDLANWVGHFYDGSGTVLEELYKLCRWQLKSIWQVVCRKDVSRHRYPIHRGIGNLVLAQLDAFEITCNRAYLKRAEYIVINAIGPNDDLVKRGLKNVEENWFYSIFLQALIRFLDIKRALQEYDAVFYYARDSLLLYADWIVQYEKPYLDNPDDLEFPNHTWAAQDIRRCAILLDAFRYAEHDRQDFLERSRYFAKYVVSTLASEPTSSYTRILAILMQNHGASAVALASPTKHALPAAIPYISILHKPHSIASLLSETLFNVLNSLRGFSLKAELNWIRVRLR